LAKNSTRGGELQQAEEFGEKRAGWGMLVGVLLCHFACWGRFKSTFKERNLRELTPKSVTKKKGRRLVLASFQVGKIR